MDAAGMIMITLRHKRKNLPSHPCWMSIYVIWLMVKRTADRFLFVKRWHLSGDMIRLGRIPPSGLWHTLMNCSLPPSLLMHESDGGTDVRVTQLEFKTEKLWQKKKQGSGAPYSMLKHQCCLVETWLCFMFMSDFMLKRPLWLMFFMFIFHINVS